MLKDMDFFNYTLKNGIRLIYKRVQSPIAHAGLFMKTGTRDELSNEHGLAHFIEHAIFKGTKKRKSYHIISRLEDVGGELNAYTTKEETCIHASFLKEYTERTFDLIADIVFCSTFPEKEIEKEKEIILDEINSYKDNPSEQIFDDFEEMMFPNHSLGRNILGTPESLSSYNRQNLLTFLNNNYFTDQMVLSFVGNLEEKDLIKIFEKYFGSEKLKMSNNKVTRKPKYQKFYLEERKKTFQTHCIIGASAYGFKSKKRIGLHLLNNVLGGPGMNSRLNMSLRERNGCSYNIESNYTAYSDTGIFEVYFGTDKENLEKCLKLVHQEFEILKNKKMGDIQFTKAKKQLMGQLAIASDHNENIMQSIGKSFLVFNKVDSLEEINKQIETISQQHFMDVANEILDTKNLSTLLFK